MSGSGTQQQTTTTSNQPYPAAKPLYDYAMGQSLDLAKSGNLFAPNTTSTVVPYSQQTTQGMNALQNTANANLGGQGLSGQAQDILGAGGYNPAQQESMQYLSGAGTNPFDLSGNQAYQGYKNNQLDQIQNRVNAGASAYGRVGSGDNTGRLVRELSNAGNQMDLQQMGRLDSLNSQRFNAGQQGISNLGAAYDLQNQPVTDLMNVGSMNEDLYGRNLNDQLRIQQETQNQPMNTLQWLNSMAGGTGSLGTQTSTAQVPGQNPFLSALGYGATGLGALGSIWGG